MLSKKKNLNYLKNVLPTDVMLKPCDSLVLFLGSIILTQCMVARISELKKSFSCQVCKIHNMILFVCLHVYKQLYLVKKMYNILV